MSRRPALDLSRFPGAVSLGIDLDAIDIVRSEQQVESMIVQGRSIMDAAIATHRPIAILAAYSGGNDSIVSTHFATSHYDAAVLHCDTSIGLPESRAHVDRTAARFGWDLRVGQSYAEGPPDKFIDGSPFDPAALPAGRWTDADTAYREFALNWGFPGNAQHPRMYQRLKLRSIAAVQRDIKRAAKSTDKILIVSGIRHDESAIRAGYKSDTKREGKSSRVWVNPFYWRTAADFEAYRQEFGLPINPVKSIIGISGECNCGAFAAPGEIELIRSVNVPFAESLTALESKVQSNGYPWCWGQGPPSWWTDEKRGQGFLFDVDDDQSTFRPMCVGCNRRSRPKAVAS